MSGRCPQLGSQRPAASKAGRGEGAREGSQGLAGGAWCRRCPLVGGTRPADQAPVCSELPSAWHGPPDAPHLGAARAQTTWVPAVWRACGEAGTDILAPRDHVPGTRVPWAGAAPLRDEPLCPLQPRGAPLSRGVSCTLGARRPSTAVLRAGSQLLEPQACSSPSPGPPLELQAEGRAGEGRQPAVPGSGKGLPGGRSHRSSR